jgi:hypothetical protein
MIRRTGLGNRIALLVIGLLLLLGGAAGLLRGLNVWPGVLGAHNSLIIDKATRNWVADQQWFWPTVAALVFLLALCWLAAQGQTRALRRITLEPDARRGTTHLPARAVTGALENDLTASPHIRHTTAALAGTSASPQLVLSVTLTAEAEPAEAVGRVGEAVQRLRTALETTISTPPSGSARSALVADREGRRGRAYGWSTSTTRTVTSVAVKPPSSRRAPATRRCTSAARSGIGRPSSTVRASSTVTASPLISARTPAVGGSAPLPPPLLALRQPPRARRPRLAASALIDGSSRITPGVLSAVSAAIFSATGVSTTVRPTFMPPPARRRRP